MTPHLRVRLLVRLSDLFPPADLSRYARDDSYVRWQSANARRWWEGLASRVMDLQGKRVVDLGCGLGGKTTYYATLGSASVVGIDCDEAKVAQARALAASQSVDCDFRRAWAEATELDDEAFDVAISDDAFEHYPDPEGVLRETHRILADGGLFVISLTTYWSPSGPHLYDFIRLPYAHLFFGHATMEAAVRRIAEREDGTDDALRSVRVRAERAIAQLHGFINRMSVRRFKAMLRRHPGWELVTFHRFADSRRGLPFVWARNLPGLEELGGHLFVVLRKAPGRIRRRDFWSAATRLEAPRVV